VSFGENHDVVLCSDSGEVSIDAGLRGAIIQVQRAAKKVGLCPHEFIALFDEGFPECPCCAAVKLRAN
jgi:hypothetical protein